MNKKNSFANILVVFGLMTLLTSLVDLLVILIPLHLANSQWVYAISQDISERSIISIIGVIAIVAGLLIRNKDTAITLNFERILGIFCFSFSFLLIILTLLFTLSLHSIQIQLADSYKQKNEGLKKQVIISYVQTNVSNGKISKAQLKRNKIPVSKELKTYLSILDKNLKFEIKEANVELFKKNVKTILNLILFAIVYIFTGITIFNSSSMNLKKLSYAKRAEADK